jgi:glycosyltransferase involved in cell wall biosynthesis
MRILQVVGPIAPCYGGPSIACPELSRELARQGHQVSIYACNKAEKECLDVPLDRPVVDEGVELRYFPALAWSGKYMFSPALWRALEETVAQFDVVHIWSVYGFFNTAAAYWCRRRQVPHMVFPHGSLDPYLRRRNRPRKWFYSKVFAERDYRGASAVLFNTNEEMRLASDWPGLQPSASDNKVTPKNVMPKRFVVPIGLDPKWFREPDRAAGEVFRQRFPALLGRRLVVYFGRLNFKKGLDILVPAFAKIARQYGDVYGDVHLVLAGPGDADYVLKVKRWLGEEGVLEKTTFTGALSGEDRFTILQQAELFVLTSYTENFGQVVCEAMASGVPVLISDQVNIWPEVARAGAGLVVPCDASATAQALGQLLDDAPRARQMGRNGRAWVAEHLPWNVVGAQMIRVYEEILRDRVPGAVSPAEIAVAR